VLLRHMPTPLLQNNFWRSIGYLTHLLLDSRLRGDDGIQGRFNGILTLPGLSETG